MKVIVYSINDCIFCERTKALLRTSGVNFTEVKVKDEAKTQFMDRFVQSHPESPRTYPRVLVVEDGCETTHPEKSQLIGGYDQTLEAVLHGSLR